MGLEPPKKTEKNSVSMVTLLNCRNARSCLSRTSVGGRPGPESHVSILPSLSKAAASSGLPAADLDALTCRSCDGVVIGRHQLLVMNSRMVIKSGVVIKS